MHNTAKVGAAAVALLSLFACGTDNTGSTGDVEEVAIEETRLEQVKNDCAPYAFDAKVGDNGQSLSIKALAGGITLVQLGCITTGLRMPDAVINRVNNTRALDGAQEASWSDALDNNYTAWWTYHPDDGLNMVIELEN